MLRHACSTPTLCSSGPAIVVEVYLVIRLNSSPLVERLVLLGVSCARLWSFGINRHVSKASVGARGYWRLFCVIVSCNERFLSAGVDDCVTCLIVSRAFS